MARTEATTEALRRLLDQAAEPADDDPRTWTPPEVLALVVQYAYAVEALRYANGGADWAELRGAGEDVLFLRDLLQEWLAISDEDALDDLLIDAFAGVPTPDESDDRLEQLYRDDAAAREFLLGEYARFRDDVAPPRDHRWWWLDAELYGRRIH